MDDSHAITGHTCSNLIIFPRGWLVDSEESFEAFCAAMKTVIHGSSSLSFNMVYVEQTLLQTTLLCCYLC